MNLQMKDEEKSMGGERRRKKRSMNALFLSLFLSFIIPLFFLEHAMATGRMDTSTLSHTLSLYQKEKLHQMRWHNRSIGYRCESYGHERRSLYLFSFLFCSLSCAVFRVFKSQIGLMNRLFSGDIPTVPWFSVSHVCRRRIKKKKQRQGSESHHLLYPSLAENLRWPIIVHLFYA